MLRPEFIYFDMGNVLVYFSHEKMAQQMAQVTGIDPQRAWTILFADKTGLEWSYERGELTRAEFYGRFCEAAEATADRDSLDFAGSDIFAINAPMCGLASQLAAAGYRLGVCSNTTPSHWDQCFSHYKPLASAFSVYALSFQLGAMKPDAAFYRASKQLIGVDSDRIFFADDRAENVAAAQEAGWDAVVYESASQINEALRRRGAWSNY